jgi:hypothetical protein
MSPDHVEGLAGLAVVLARLNEPKLAKERIKAALLREQSGMVYYYAGSTYALTAKNDPDDADIGIMYLRRALYARFGTDVIETDNDLAALKRKPSFKELLRQAATLRTLVPVK